jgi:hypothetical protein
MSSNTIGPAIKDAVIDLSHGLVFPLSSLEVEVSEYERFLEWTGSVDLKQ